MFVYYSNSILNIFLSGASKNGTDSISGEVVKTTVSEMTFKAKKDDHQKFVTCKGRNEALDEPVIREVVLNVLCKFICHGAYSQITDSVSFY